MLIKLNKNYYFKVIMREILAQFNSFSKQMTNESTTRTTQR